MGVANPFGSSVMSDWIASPEAWVALVSLTALEIVLGIDNIIFISILVGGLPAQRRDRARLQGFALAMLTRILLLLSLAWMMRLTEPFFSLLPDLLAPTANHHLRDALVLSGRDLILLSGGLFLLWKSAHEIYQSMEGDPADSAARVPSRYWMVLAQIAVIDIVFSLDSVITAVGMVQHVPVMVIAIVLAIVLAVGIMMLFAKSIGELVDAHPSIKMLALSFLTLVGVVLIVEGLGQHLPKGYIYFAMAFSLGVEMLNIRARRLRAAGAALACPEPVHLHTAPHAARPDEAGP